MGKRQYMIPEMEIIPMDATKLLDGFSEDPEEAPVIDGGELDSNTSTFDEAVISGKGLWNEE